MADAALFLGWGEARAGREKQGLDVFNGAVQYYGQLQQDGKIESFEVVLLGLHGGDLDGFVLIRGTREQLNEIRASDEFQRQSVRADYVVRNVGIVDAWINEGVGQLMSSFTQELDALGA